MQQLTGSNIYTEWGRQATYGDKRDQYRPARTEKYAER